MVRRLFSHIVLLQIRTVTFPHVVDPSHVQTFVVSSAAHAPRFNFVMQNRKNEAMLLALGHFLIDTARVVPGGMVVFFPSYSFGL